MLLFNLFVSLLGFLLLFWIVLQVFEVFPTFNNQQCSHQKLTKFFFSIFDCYRWRARSRWIFLLPQTSMRLGTVLLVPQRARRETAPLRAWHEEVCIDDWWAFKQVNNES